MSELPEGIPPGQPAEPRESASGIVVRRAEDGAWQALLGVRSRRSRFMPGHLAFPGGMLDPGDRPGETGAFARCVRREMHEETGLDIDEGCWIEAGERTTPPLFSRRFHTVFFVVEWPEDAEPPVPATEEIESLGFMRPSEVVHDWERGVHRVAPPTLPILRALGAETGEIDDLAARVTRANAGEERAPRIEFVPGVWMFPARTATLPPATHTNVWMPGGERFAIVDPGSTEPDENRRLTEVIERRCRLGQRPSAVVLTHEHRDHVGGAATVARALDLPVRAHALVLDALASQLDGCERRPIADGEELDLGGAALRAYHTPGHASGHLAFHDQERGVLIAGDLVSGVSTILIDPDNGSMADYLESLRRVRELKPRTVFAGHGPPIPGRAIGQLLDHRAQREAKIVERLGPIPSELAEIARSVYADVPQMPSALTERQTLAHLIHLESRGAARRSDDTGRSWSAGTERVERRDRAR